MSCDNHNLEVISTLRQVHDSHVPPVPLVTNGAEELLVARISAVNDLKESDVGTKHVIPELKLARFSSLSEEWTDQVSGRKETRAVRHLSVDVIT